MTWDVCIVGGGIAGLYTACALLERVPTARVLVMESDRRPGGRARTMRFHGVEVVRGAGVGRRGRDTLLASVLADMRLSHLSAAMPMHVAWRTPRVQSSNAAARALPALERVRRAATRLDPEQRAAVTFGELARDVLGEEGFLRAVDAVGYTDYEHADAVDTALHYGFEDVLPGSAGFFTVPWRRLVDRLATRAQRLGATLRLGTRVTSVRVVRAGHGARVLITAVQCARGGRHEAVVERARGCVLAAPIDALHALLPPDTLAGIGSHRFVRVYAAIDARASPGFARAVRRYTVVGAPLQKIVPVNPARGVYMVAYADNQSADAVLALAQNAGAMAAALQKALRLKHAPRVVAMRHAYWLAGTHYFTPLSARWQGDRDAHVHALQRPLGSREPVFVVGEAVSRYNQGWTQGALESVLAVLPDVANALGQTRYGTPTLGQVNCGTPNEFT